MRLGRGDATIEEWSDLRREAAEGRNGRTRAICSASLCSAISSPKALEEFGVDWSSERTTPVH